jgi:hypothetical protein
MCEELPMKRRGRANYKTAVLTVLTYGSASRFAFGAPCALTRQFGTVAIGKPLKTKLPGANLPVTKLLDTKRKVKKPFWEAFGLLQERLFKKMDNEINCLACLLGIALNRSLSAATPYSQNASSQCF